MPLLTVFNRPPDAVAIHHMLESLSLTAMSVIRPPIFAGPRQRQFRLFSHCGSSGKSGVDLVAAVAELDVEDDSAAEPLGCAAGFCRACTSFSSVCSDFSIC